VRYITLLSIKLPYMKQKQDVYLIFNVKL
jgi:hypothetical protein